MVVAIYHYIRVIALVMGMCTFVVLPNYAQVPLLEEENKFDKGKLEIVCQAIKFYLTANAQVNASNGIDCSSLEAVEGSIPEDYKATNRFFKLFKRKRYRSYGRGKLNRRLGKLIKDIETELRKVRRDTAWNNGLTRLMTALNKTREQVVNSTQPKSTSLETADTVKTTQNVDTKETIQQPKKNTPNQTEDSTMSTILSIVAILALGGLAYFFYQKMNELKQQIAELDEVFREKYSRLDNRIDMMTPIQDFRSVFPQIQQVNGDVNALNQEIQLLKTRNQFKISPEELYAKRTEHLETHHYNPEIQIYYAKFTKDLNGFSQDNLRTEPSKEHIYKVEINVENPNEAIFQIVNRNEYHHLALNYEGSMLAPANEYLNRPVNAYRIITKKPGRLMKENDTWIITEKAHLEFE